MGRVESGRQLWHATDKNRVLAESLSTLANGGKLAVGKLYFVVRACKISDQAMVRAPSGKASRIMKIERILKSELMDFAAELQAFPGAYLPLSTVRAEALAHHPFSEADTPMLYLLREGEELVGFQSV